MEFDELLRRFNRPKRIHAGGDIRRSYQVRCPAHNDSKPSLTISERNDGKILLYCHGNCSTEQVLGAIGLEFKDIGAGVSKPSCLERQEWYYANKAKWEDESGKTHEGYGDGVTMTAEYRFIDELGNYLYSKLRFEGGQIKGKLIRFYYVDRVADEARFLKESERKRTLYNLRNILRAEHVFYVEGEKDADTMIKLGGAFAYVTTAGSASDWRREFARFFKGKKVTILRDNDEAGLRCAEQVQKDLRQYAFYVKIVNPSNLDHGDVTDYLTKEGGSARSLEQLIAETPGGQYASWVNVENSGRATVNAALLSKTISDNEPHFIVRNMTDDRDTFYLYRDGVYRPKNRNGMKALIREYVPTEKITDNMLNAVYNLLLATQDGIRGAGEYDSDPRYINFRNGLYDLQRKELIPHSPEVFSTFQFSFDYKPENTKREHFEKYINDLCSKPDGSIDNGEIAIIQEYLGFIISNEPMSKIKAAMVLWSRQGNSGKSVFIRLISDLLGGMERVASIKLKELTAENRFILGTLPESRLIACGDESNSNVTDSSIFKALTGGDPVKIEPKGKQPFSYIFRGGFVIACNGLPSFTDDKGDHLYKRLLILPCEHHITDEEKDPDLSEKLYQERQAIFNWALDGFYRLKENGFVFSQSESSTLSREEYRCAMDNVYRFIQEGYEITRNHSDRISKTEFDQKYSRWAAADESIKAVETKNLAARMQSYGIHVTYGNVGDRRNVAIYCGIKVKEFHKLTPEEADLLPFEQAE